LRALTNGSVILHILDKLYQSGVAIRLLAAMRRKKGRGGSVIEQIAIGIVDLRIVPRCIARGYPGDIGANNQNNSCVLRTFMRAEARRFARDVCLIERNT
jgi:hypothetical protein